MPRRPRGAGAFVGQTFAALLAFFCISLIIAKPSGAAETEKLPAQVQALLKLLADPQVGDWLRQNAKPAPASADGLPDSAGEGAAPTSLTALISQQLKSIREHAGSLVATVSRMPAEYGRAKLIFEEEYDNYSRLGMLLLVGVFIALGLAVEWLFWRLTAPLRRAHENPSLENVGDRVRTVTVRFLLGVGLMGSFAFGSVGVFLAVDWPDLLKEILLTYLLAFLGIRLAIVIGRFLLSPPGRAAPTAARFRLVPLQDRGAPFWYRSVILGASWMSLGSATIQLSGTFGFSSTSRELLYDLLVLGLLLIGGINVWRAPPSFYEPSRFIQRWGRRPIAVFVTIFSLALWLLWVGTFYGVFALFLVLLGVPTLVAVAQRSVNHILRPPGADHELAAPHSVQAVILERGVRAVLITGAAYLLGMAWGVDLASLTMQDTFVTRIMRNVLNAVVIILVADVLWHVAGVLIDSRLREVGPGGSEAVHDSEKHARQRTLLPILRNVLGVTIVVITGMMVLAGMGVAIGPLIASAGVLGVALGFGSQTLVRDVISGIFYLFDDAFRVGEYIQSGNYKGTVESFSLRSVKLRHHRGPLYTIPFGSLGAVQNMSRDWTIEKVNIGVAYNTDVAQVKKLIKQIGQQLQADPELASSIIETLKLQGIQSFGDYGMQLRVKIMTKAGEQFTARRRALALIKAAFDAHGISFAFPTVQVSEPANWAAAAARQGLEMRGQGGVDGFVDESNRKAQFVPMAETANAHNLHHEHQAVGPA